MKSTEQIALEFCAGGYDKSYPDSAWHAVYRHIVENCGDLTFNKEEMYTKWIESGMHLRRKVGDDTLVLQVLKLTLPPYQGGEMILYRGESRTDYHNDRLGFCWTTSIDTARMYTTCNAEDGGKGSLLKATAPKHAIISAGSSHSDYLSESEYTCDPYALESVEVIG